MLKIALEQYKKSQAQMSNQKSSAAAFENENRQPNVRPQAPVNFIQEANQSKRLPIQQAHQTSPINLPQPECSANPYLLFPRRQAMSDLTVLINPENSQSLQPYPRHKDDELMFNLEGLKK